ncbi:loricrin-like [Olea europaea var. sylvestris]|uniref:loricrin-like n=1 Tax=Olea europaea var. sylvestris TaxID=158386 RepID=UPI000C1CE415|nr:loricrin-like [Olea europaea var. sylvestris]
MTCSLLADIDECLADILCSYFLGFGRGFGDQLSWSCGVAFGSGGGVEFGSNGGRGFSSGSDCNGDDGGGSNDDGSGSGAAVADKGSGKMVGFGRGFGDQLSWSCGVAFGSGGGVEFGSNGGRGFSSGSDCNGDDDGGSNDEGSGSGAAVADKGSSKMVVCCWRQ